MDTQKALQSTEQRLTGEVDARIVPCTGVTPAQTTQLQGELNALRVEQYQDRAKLAEQAALIERKAADISALADRIATMQVPVPRRPFTTSPYLVRRSCSRANSGSRRPPRSAMRARPSWTAKYWQCRHETRPVRYD